MSKGLPRIVKQSIEKSRDSALLAVETYNKPAVKFKSGGYIVLMTIAWTSLFHAIFFREKIKPFYRKQGKKTFEKKDGDYCYWELKTCVKEYFKNDTNNPIRKNIEFFIPLRNKIEHKSMPELDSNLFAECQALLLNYDTILEKEFGIKYCIRESLSFSLQLFPSTYNLSAALKENSDAQKVKLFIDKYRSSLSTEILESGNYSFKAFLVQVSNHQSKEAPPIQFIRYDTLTDEDKRNLNRVATILKIQEKPVNHSGLILPGDVVKKVQKALGFPKVNKNGRSVDKFNQDTHTRCWKKYSVRPLNGVGNPANTKSEYCIYNALSKNYGYTQKWVDFLVEEMSSDEKYNSLF